MHLVTRRFSSAQQKGGDSITRQTRSAEEWCDKHGFTLSSASFEDLGVSAFKGANAEVGALSTSKIIDLSVEVLNEGLRPHLTKWQARFRHWYEYRTEDVAADIDPQTLQRQFPAYEELMTDLLAVNERLIAYRKKMNELVRG